LLDRGALSDLLVAADLAQAVPSVSQGATLREALRAMNASASDALPVVDGDGQGGRYVGLLTRHELLAAYERELVHEV